MYADRVHVDTGVYTYLTSCTGQHSVHISGLECTHILNWSGHWTVPMSNLHFKLPIRSLCAWLIGGEYVHRKTEYTWTQLMSTWTPYMYT